MFAENVLKNVFGEKMAQIKFLVVMNNRAFFADF